jgi:hypothetical protein
MSTRSLALPLLAVLISLFAACGNNDSKLKVTGIEPDKGDVEGGTYVRIKGNGFIQNGPIIAKVFFGSRLGTVVRTASDSEMIVEAPGGKPNETVDVLILIDGKGELKIPHGFTFIEKAQGPDMTVDQLDTKKAK